MNWYKKSQVIQVASPVLPVMPVNQVIPTSDFLSIERNILLKSKIPEAELVNYISDSLADGADLREQAGKVQSGEMSVEEAAEHISQDWANKKQNDQIKIAQIKIPEIPNPVDGKSKPSARNYVYKLVGKLTKGFFRDSSWENVGAIWGKLNENNIPNYLIDAKYFHDEKGQPIGKTWYFEIPFVNNRSNQDKLQGTLNAHFCGSVQDPSDRYDISFII